MLHRAILACAVVMMTAPLASAGPIDSACVRSERGNGNARLCGCVQQVANMTLSRTDQRRAASFFRDPHQAQVVRMSKTNADNAFWKRYKRFASTAEQYCTR